MFMVIDVAIAVIVILAMVFGFRSGFVYAFLHMIGWIAAIVISFVWTPAAKEFLLENTDLYDFIYTAISERLTDAAGAMRVSAALPGLITDMAAASVSDFLFTVLAFLLVIIAVKIVFLLLIKLLSKKYHSGMRGIFDGSLGLIVGFVKGICITFILLAVLIPVLGLIDSGFVDVVRGWLDSSYFSGTLYDANIFVLIIRDFLV